MAQPRTREPWIARHGSEVEWNGFLGAPIAEVDPQDDVQIRHGFYVIRYDTGERFPVWTAHVITRESALRSESEAFGRPGWKAEPALADLGERNLTDEDFVGLSAALEDGTRVDLHRGHMTGKDEMEGFGKEAMEETFFLSNVVAQSARNNSPFWASLEKRSLKWAKKFGRAWVLTGPAFESPGRPDRFVANRGGDAVPIANKVWKLVIVENGGNLHAAAFLAPQTETKASKLFEYQKTIAELESATGLRFFPDAGGVPEEFRTEVDPLFSRN